METKIDLIKQQLEEMSDETFMYVHNQIYFDILGYDDMEIYNEDLFNDYLTNGMFNPQVINPFQLICFSDCNGSQDYITFDGSFSLIDCSRTDAFDELIDELMSDAEYEEHYDKILELINEYVY